MKKYIILIAALMAMQNTFALTKTVYADEVVSGTAISYDNTENTGNLTYASGVDEKMCHASYWKDKLGRNAQRLLMTGSEIEELNAKMLAEPKTCMHDLENMPETYTASPIVRELPKEEYYVNGKRVYNSQYFGKMIKAMKETGYSGEMQTQYAVVTKRADMKDWPTEDIVGYSANDTDDELQGSAMNVNEPFVIRQKCEIDGKTFYNGATFNCEGWVPADCLAICASKKEWLNAWKVDINAKDFIVVIQDKISLEPSIYVPEISDVDLMIGTVLKLVPKDKMPETVAERGTWNNYVVYLPTRDEKGNYVRQPALISQHHNVSVGYLPLTQGNVLDVSFGCLGNRYGWGGMLGAMDCSMYARQIYRCFGLEIPRNTTWQTQIPERVSDISAMTDEEKLEFFKGIPVGSLLMFRGHITVYIGSENGMAYVISDTGSLSDSVGELKVIGQMSVIINPLDVRRGNGTTWLKNMISAVTFGEGNTKYVFGDADADGIITATDSTVILQKVLAGNYEMPIEKKTAAWMMYADADNDGKLTAADASTVLQKVLVSSYKMPAE